MLVPLGGLFGVGLAASVLAVWLGTGGGARWLANTIEEQVEARTRGGTFVIELLDPGLYEWTAGGISLSDAAGNRLLTVDQVTLNVDPWTLLRGAVHLPSATISGVHVVARRDESGAVDWASLFVPSGSTEPTATPVHVRVDALAIDDVDFTFETPEGPSLEVDGGWLYGRLVARTTTFDLSELESGATLTTPGGVEVGAWGGVQWDSVRGAWLRDLELEVGDSMLLANGTAGRTMNLEVAVGSLQGADLGPFVGRPLAGSWRGALTAKGPPRDFEVVANFDSPDGDGALALLGRVDTTGAVPRWSAEADLDTFHVEAVDPSLARPVVLDGHVWIEGRGTTPATIDARGHWTGRDVVLYGQAADAVDADFRLQDGTVILAPSPVVGILGSMTVAGTYGLTTGALALTVDSDLSPARLAALGAVGLGGDGTVSATVSRLPGSAAVRIQGVARYAPFRYGDDVSLRSVQAPFDVTVESGATRGTFDLAGTGVSAYGTTASTVTGRGLRLRRSAEGVIDVGGTVSTPDVAYATYVTAATALTTFDFHQVGAHRTVQAQTVVGVHELVGLPAGGGVVATTVVDDQVRAVVHLGTGTRATLDTVARYDLRTAALVLDELSFAPTPRTTWTAVEPVSFTVVEGGIRDARIHVKSTVGELELRGALGTTGPVDGRVSVVGLELDHLTELWPDRWSLGGRLDLEASVTGDAAAPVVDAELEVERLFVNENVRWMDVAGRLHLADGTLSPELSFAAVGAPVAHLTGAFPMVGGLAEPGLALDGPAALELAVVPGPIARLRTLFPGLEGTDLPEGVASASLEITGALRDPSLRIAGVAEVPLPGFTEVGRTEFELRRTGGSVWFDGVVRDRFALRGKVDGTGTSDAAEVFAWLHGTGPEVDVSAPDAWLRDYVARVVLAELPTEGLAVAAGAPLPLTGRLLGGFVVQGTPSRPVAEGALNWVDASIGGQKVEGAWVSVKPSDGGGYLVDLTAALPEDGGIEIAGQVPVLVDFEREPADWSLAPMDLTVSGAGVPVSLLGAVNPDVRGVSGLVQVAGTIGGTFDHPRPDLVVHGESLDLLYRPLLLATEGATLDGRLTPEAVTFDIVAPTTPARKFTTVDLEPGVNPRIATSGTIAIVDGSFGDLDAKVHFVDGAWVSATDLTRIRTTGDLRIDSTWAKPRIRGDLELVQGRVGIEAAGFVDSAPLTLAPTLTVVRANEPAPPPPPSPEEPWAFDIRVDVDLGRNLQLELSMPFVDQLGQLGAAVSRVDLSTRLGGDVRVRMDAGDPVPTLVGELELVEGTVRILRSTFDLEEGHITFAGGDPYESAELDVSAQMAVSGSTLDLTITGTPVDPKFQMVSEEFPDPTEQMVILVTGSAPDELTADQGAGAALSLLWSSAFAGLRLGSFSIEPTGAVRLGIPVSRRVFASTTWALSQDPNVNQLTFEADWSLSRHLVLNGAVGDRQSWGDLYWEVRF